MVREKENAGRIALASIIRIEKKNIEIHVGWRRLTHRVETIMSAKPEGSRKEEENNHGQRANR